MSEVPKVYGSHVSRILASFGFVRGDRRKPGYRAHGQNQSYEHGYLPTPDSGRVTVEHLGAQEEQTIERYAGALETAGFHVETRMLAATGRPYVVVLGRGDAAASAPSAVQER